MAELYILIIDYLLFTSKPDKINYPISQFIMATTSRMIKIIYKPITVNTY